MRDPPAADRVPALVVGRGRDRGADEVDRAVLGIRVRRIAERRPPGLLPGRRIEGEELASEVEERAVHALRLEDRGGAVERVTLADRPEVERGAGAREAHAASRGV